MFDAKRYWELRSMAEGQDPVSNIGKLPSENEADFRAMSLTLKDHMKPVSSLLDVGCGYGRFYPLLLKYCDHYTGLDFCEPLLLQNPAGQEDDDRIVLGDASDIPFDDKEFDAVLSITVLQHIIDEQLFNAAIDEVMRVARKYVYLLECMDSPRPSAPHFVFRDTGTYINPLLDDFRIRGIIHSFDKHYLVIGERK